jgi:hypothetical protein
MRVFTWDTGNNLGEIVSVLLCNTLYCIAVTAAKCISVLHNDITALLCAALTAATGHTWSLLCSSAYSLRCIHRHYFAPDLHGY